MWPTNALHWAAVLNPVIDKDGHQSSYHTNQVNRKDNPANQLTSVFWLVFLTALCLLLSDFLVLFIIALLLILIGDTSFRIWRFCLLINLETYVLRVDLVVLAAIPECLLFGGCHEFGWGLIWLDGKVILDRRAWAN